MNVHRIPLPIAEHALLLSPACSLLHRCTYLNYVCGNNMLDIFERIDVLKFFFLLCIVIGGLQRHEVKDSSTQTCKCYNNLICLCKYFIVKNVMNKGTSESQFRCCNITDSFNTWILHSQLWWSWQKVVACKKNNCPLPVSTANLYVQSAGMFHVAFAKTPFWTAWWHYYRVRSGTARACLLSYMMWAMITV